MEEAGRPGGQDGQGLPEDAQEQGGDGHYCGQQAGGVGLFHGLGVFGGFFEVHGPHDAGVVEERDDRVDDAHHGQDPEPGAALGQQGGEQVELADEAGDDEGQGDPGGPAAGGALRSQGHRIAAR